MRSRTKAEMYPLVELWQASDQSKKRFCHAHQINIATFSYWQQKYRSELGIRHEAEKPPKFLALQVAHDERLDGRVAMELIYPNGVRLDLNGPVSISYIASLVQLLD